MINIFLSVISYDIWFYISHVILHNNLYIYHKDHHYKLVPNYIDTYVAHVIESPFQGIGMFFPFILYTYTVYDIFIILAFLNIRGMMRHDERCVFLVGNHHLLHHKYPNYNFSEYWVDYLCGTTYPNKDEYKRGLLCL
jgi:sterol desaturase/sphingolipid hydroxylase (fatty acid hydroxylase superfamily)